MTENHCNHKLQKKKKAGQHPNLLIYAFVFCLFLPLLKSEIFSAESASGQKNKVVIDTETEFRQSCLKLAMGMIDDKKFRTLDEFAAELLQKCEKEPVPEIPQKTDKELQVRTNRSLIILDGWLYALGGSVPARKRLTLNGRTDLARHFCAGVLLGLTCTYENGLAVARAKEMLDVRKGGSGYDFNDQAASIFGLRFAIFCRNLDEKQANFLFSELVSRSYPLSSASPATRYPHLKTGKLPTAEQRKDFSHNVEKVWENVLIDLSNRVNPENVKKSQPEPDMADKGGKQR